MLLEETEDPFSGDIVRVERIGESARCSGPSPSGGETILAHSGRPGDSMAGWGRGDAGREHVPDVAERLLLRVTRRPPGGSDGNCGPCGRAWTGRSGRPRRSRTRRTGGFWARGTGTALSGLQLRIIVVDLHTPFLCGSVFGVAKASVLSDGWQAAQAADPGEHGKRLASTAHTI